MTLPAFADEGDGYDYDLVLDETEGSGNPAAAAEDEYSESQEGEGTEEPTGEGTEEPSGEGTEDPSGEGTEEPTGEGTEEPSGEGTEEPTGEGTEEPAGEGTEEPTGEGTEEPTGEGTEEPSGENTEEPTGEGTEEPTGEGTEEPTGENTEEPAGENTEEPTGEGTEEPTVEVTDPEKETESKQDPAAPEKEEEDKPAASGDKKTDDSKTSDKTDNDKTVASEEKKDGKELTPEEKAKKEEEEKKKEEEEKKKKEEEEKKKKEEEEKKKKEEEMQQRIANLPTFTAKPLYNMSTEDMIVCSFCRSQGLGQIQTAVLLAYINTQSVNSTIQEADPAPGTPGRYGLTGTAYREWCAQTGRYESELRSQLAYLVSILLEETDAEDPVMKNRSIFCGTDKVSAAATSFYMLAVGRGMTLPYTKEEIKEIVIPAARQYLALLSSGDTPQTVFGSPYYCQGIYNGVPYDEGSVMDSGCGITAFSMVASALTGLNLDPTITGAWGYLNGADTVKDWSAFRRLSARFGIRCLGQYSGDCWAALDALANGCQVIVSIRKDGFFTTSDEGHYLVLTGLAEDGRLYVSDPASLERSQQGPFSIDAVFGCSLQYWIFAA